MRYERIFKEAVGKYKPVIEDIAGRKIGDVAVEPMPGNDLLEIGWRKGAGLILYMGGVIGAEVPLENFMKDSKPLVRFNSALTMNLLPRKVIECVAAHEIGHLAHLRGKTLRELARRNEYTTECVADYIAILAMGTPNIPFQRSRLYEALGHIEGTLKRLKMPFKEALPILGFEG